MKTKVYVLIVFLCFLSIITFLKYDTGYIKDLLFSFSLIIIFFLLYKNLKLTSLTYFLLCFSLLVHNMGAFGFYSVSPVGIAYDYLTHFIGLFSASLVIGNIFSVNLSKDKKFRANDVLILFLILVTVLGVGSLIETFEFTGYLIWGEGEGFFEFGTGDYGGLADIGKLTTRVGGGYFDAMEDLIVNLGGGLLGVVLFGIVFFKFKKERI